MVCRDYRIVVGCLPKKQGRDVLDGVKPKENARCWKFLKTNCDVAIMVCGSNLRVSKSS